MEEKRKRQSWSEWRISAPFDQQVPGAAAGVTEQRCYVQCPIAGCKKPRISVAFANAKKNLSITARQHLKDYHAETADEGALALPNSKRLCVKDVDQLHRRVEALQQQLVDMQEQRERDKQDILHAIAHAARLPEPVETVEVLVTQVRTKARVYDNMDRTLTCSICMERRVEAMIRPCGHAVVCRHCTARWAQHGQRHGGGPRCPECRVAVEKVYPLMLGSVQ